MKLLTKVALEMMKADRDEGTIGEGSGEYYAGLARGFLRACADDPDGVYETPLVPTTGETPPAGDPKITLHGADPREFHATEFLCEERGCRLHPKAACHSLEWGVRRGLDGGWFEFSSLSQVREWLTGDLDGQTQGPDGPFSYSLQPDLDVPGGHPSSAPSAPVEDRMSAVEYRLRRALEWIAGYTPLPGKAWAGSDAAIMVETAKRALRPDDPLPLPSVEPQVVEGLPTDASGAPAHLLAGAERKTTAAMARERGYELGASVGDSICPWALTPTQMDYATGHFSSLAQVRAWLAEGALAGPSRAPSIVSGPEVRS